MSSLRRKLQLWLLAPLVPLLLVGAAAAFYMANHFVNLAYDRSLFRAALALADQVEVVSGNVMVDLPQAAFDMLEYDKDDWIYYQVLGARGEFVTGYTELPKPPVTNPQAGEHYYYTARYDGKPVHVVAFYLSLEGTSVDGVALVQVAETTAKRQRMVNEIMIGMLLPQLLMIVIAAVVVRRGVRRGLRPLEQLRQDIAARSHLDLAPLNAASSPDEVQPLLLAMNDLMSRLEQALAQQQRFVADASHQLRTPLAGLKTQAEIALRERQDPEQVLHALQRILASSDSLTHLIDQLLVLARMEPECVGTFAMGMVDLARLTREVTGEWVPKALEKDIDLGLDAQEGECRVMGEPALLREVLANLIDNAIRYTGRGGRVTVGLRREDGGVLLSVEDDGPGIPLDQRARVFERFYRILGSGEPGSGLGLSIVREIVLLHAGSIWLADVPGGKGLRVRVRLPRI